MADQARADEVSHSVHQIRRYGGVVEAEGVTVAQHERPGGGQEIGVTLERGDLVPDEILYGHPLVGQTHEAGAMIVHGEHGDIKVHTWMGVPPFNVARHLQEKAGAMMALAFS